MNAGQKDQWVEIQYRAKDPDQVGQNQGDWREKFKCWARAKPMRPRDVFAAGQVQQVFDVAFTIDWRSDVTGSMRVLWNGVPHEIVGQPVNVDGRCVDLELMTVAGLVAGR
jgi:SPP1 family predicted phage head-tail adaptor